MTGPPAKVLRGGIRNVTQIGHNRLHPFAGSRRHSGTAVDDAADRSSTDSGGSGDVLDGVTWGGESFHLVSLAFVTGYTPDDDSFGTSPKSRICKRLQSHSALFSQGVKRLSRVPIPYRCREHPAPFFREDVLTGNLA